MVARTWYDALLWASKQLDREGKKVLRKPFTTVDLAEVLEGDGREYAHSVTQKLWKWGYLRKAVGERGLEAAEEARERVHASRKGSPGSTHGGAGRGQGRYPSVWFVTNKGIWRASQPRELRRSNGSTKGREGSRGNRRG